MNFLLNFNFLKKIKRKKILVFSFFLIVIVLIGLNVFFFDNFSKKNQSLSPKHLQKKQLINNVNSYFQKYSSFLAFGSEMNLDFDSLYKLLKTKDEQNKLLYMRRINDVFPVVSFKNIEFSENFLKIFNDSKKKKALKLNISLSKEKIFKLIERREWVSKIKNYSKIFENFDLEKQILDTIENSFIVNKNKNNFFDIFESSYFKKIIDYSEKIMLFWYNIIPDIKNPNYKLYSLSQNTREKKLFNLYTYIKENLPSEKFYELITKSLDSIYEKNPNFLKNEAKAKKIQKYIVFLKKTKLKNPFEEKNFHINRYPNNLFKHFTDNFIIYLVKEFLINFEKSLNKINSLIKHGKYSNWKVLWNDDDNDEPKKFKTLTDTLSKDDALIEIQKQIQKENLIAKNYFDDIKCHKIKCEPEQKKIIEKFIDDYWKNIKQKNKNIKENYSLFWKNIFTDFFSYNDWKSKVSNFLSFFLILKIIDKKDNFNSDSYQSISFFYQNLNFEDSFFDTFYYEIKKQLWSKLDKEGSIIQKILIEQFGKSRVKLINSFKDNKFFSLGLNVLETSIKGTFTLLKKEINNIFRKNLNNNQFLTKYFKKYNLKNIFTSIPKLLWKHRSFLNEKINSFQKTLLQYKNEKDENVFYENTNLQTKLLSQFIDFIYQLWEKIFKNLENYKLKIFFFSVMQILFKTKIIDYEKNFFKFLENFNFFIEPEIIEIILQKINKFIFLFKDGYRNFIKENIKKDSLNFQNLLISLGFDSKNKKFKDNSFFQYLIDSISINKLETPKTNYIIKDIGTSNNIDRTTLAKKTSIETYGDLIKKIFVSFDGEYKFNAIEKEANKLNFEKLKTEYNKQSDTPITGDLTIENIDFKLFIDLYSFIEAKAKKSKSLYGDLINETIKIDYENDYTFQVGSKTKLNLAELNKQLNIQGDTVNKDYTIDNFGNLNFDTTKTLAKAKIKKEAIKQTSINRYGDLTTELFVSYEETEFKFNIEENDNKLNFVDLKIEYNKQSDTPINEDLTILNIGSVTNPLLTNIDSDSLEVAKAKAKKTSIDINGDLTTKIIEFDYDGTDYTFQVKGKPVISLNQLNIELNKQGDTVKDDYTIDNLPLNIDEIKTLAKAKSKKSKILYGDLINGTIKIDYETDYTFQVEEKTKLNLIELNNQLDIQGDTVNKDYTIDNFGNLNFDTTKTFAKAKIKKSKTLYGNLTTESIKVDYENENFTFQIENKQKLNSLTEFNDQLDNQGDTEKDYTIDKFGNLNIDPITLTKAKTKKNNEEKNWKLIFTKLFNKNGIFDQFLFFVSDFLEQNFYYYLQFSNWKIKNPSNANEQYKIIFNNNKIEKLDFDIEFVTSFQKNGENLFSYLFRWNFLEKDDGYRFQLKNMRKLNEKN